MTNVDILEQIGILGDIRERLGAENSNDETYDEKINRMDANAILKEWSGWHIGDSYWWTEMKYIYDQIIKQQS